MADKDMRYVHVRLGAQKGYEIKIGAGALQSLGAVARQTLAPEARRIAVISNRRVFELYGEPALSSLRDAGFIASYWLMGDGEKYKSLRTAERALQFFSEAGLERSDGVAALGGGVVGDLAGFAAALYLRGVGYIQIPTTLLAQIDSSVGGKTAVNTRIGKNLIGAFHQPRAVISDTSTLVTLPARELTAGWCEAIKQGAVGNRRLFDRTRRFLADKDKLVKEIRTKTGDREDLNWQAEPLARLIAAQCAFKAQIVAHDEREEMGRTDARSRRILNFGHTVGHALEAVTSYKRFRHGEAVGYGMIVAGEISARMGMLEVSELELLRTSIRLAGRLPHADDLDKNAVLRALKSDKKSIGGHLQWVLLEKIGQALIVSGGEVSPHIVRASLRAALSA